MSCSEIRISRFILGQSCRGKAFCTMFKARVQGRVAAGKRMRGWIGSRTTPIALSIASIVLLGGCAATAGIRLGDLPQPTVRSGWTNAGVRDQRRAFAAAFCDVYANTSQDLDKRCEDWIWQPPDSELTDARAPSASIAGQRTLVIAPGIFGECVAPWVAPFSSDYAALEALGYHVKVLPLEGRASSKRNARIINAQLSDLRLECRPTPDLCEAVNLSQTALLIIDSALRRKESRGLHYTTDFPETIETERHDTIMARRHYTATAAQ